MSQRILNVYKKSGIFLELNLTSVEAIMAIWIGINSKTSKIIQHLNRLRKQPENALITELLTVPRRIFTLTHCCKDEIQKKFRF